MPPSGEYAGLGPKDTPVRLVAGADLNAARLNATEGFVLSRIDGTSTLGTLCLISGLGMQATCDILRRLAELGLIRVGEGRLPPRAVTGSFKPAAAAPRARPRSQTPTYNRIPFAAQTGAVRPAEAASSEISGSWTPPRGVSIEPVPDEPDVELKPELRATVRTFYVHLKELNFFQLLGVDVSADATTIRRAYFKRSKEFHPDRYFRKRTGPYKSMLDEIFKQISAAYHFLEDDSQRVAYRDMVIKEAADEATLAQVEAQGAQAMQETAVSDSYELPPLDAAPPPRPRTRSGLRPKFPWEVRPPAPTAEFPAAAPPPAAPPSAAPPLSLDEQKARDERRQDDRKRRIRRITGPTLGRTQQWRQFHEQGMQQLERGQVLAAAASLKLALAFGSTDPEVQRAYEEAAEKSRSQTAENYFKRGVFEESVGRVETAQKYFMQAADAHPKSAYLVKAAEAALTGGDLMRAREYGTRAVQIDLKSVDARITLARIYEAAGMTRNARREIEEALTLEPGNTTAKEIQKAIKWG